MQLAQAQVQFDIQKLQQEAEIKQRLMAVEFEYQMALAQAQGGNKKALEELKEDRKDERTRIQASQQSEMIEQRKNENALPKKFESAGLDVLGGFGTEQYDPK